jgi:hypothetical protein
LLVGIEVGVLASIRPSLAETALVSLIFILAAVS